jgi:hypothetical protein
MHALLAVEQLAGLIYFESVIEASAVWLRAGGNLAKFDLKEYARVGAEARARELQSELESIYRAFPDLRQSSRDGRASVAKRRGHRRKPMSAAQKRAVGLRMKKYWAERRKAQAK